MSNRFKKHPVMTLLFMSLVFTVFSLYGAEYLLPLISEDTIVMETNRRNIRLREHIPGTLRQYYPSSKLMQQSDNLEQKKYRLKIDPDGFIFPSKMYDDPDATILFLGGSTTECAYVEEDRRFPFLVGKLLGSDGLKVNTLNSGVSGNNTLHSVDILINKAIAFEPDIAVLMHNINDLNLLLYDQTYWNDDSKFSLLVKSSENNLSCLKRMVKYNFPNLYNQLYTVIQFISSKGGDVLVSRALPPDYRLSLEKENILMQFKKSLRLFITASRIYRITPVIMTQASRFGEKLDVGDIDAEKLFKKIGVSYEAYREIYMEMNQMIRQVGREEGVLVIDLEKKVPQSKAYIYDFVHFNTSGSERVAKIIAEELKQTNFFQRLAK